MERRTVGPSRGLRDGTVKEVDIELVRSPTGERERRKDLIAVEKPVHVLINGVHYATIMCTPEKRAELVLGHLLSEGIVKSPQEIRSIDAGRGGLFKVTLAPGIDEKARVTYASPFARIITSACSPNRPWLFPKLVDRVKPLSIESRLKLDTCTISLACKRLNELAEKFRATGGLHAAGLFSADGSLEAFAEDIGRHNAVDKVIGIAIKRRLRFGDCFLACSGRLSGDMVLKAVRVGIPIIASIASALSSGVDMAEVAGATLIGFVRGQRMNVYTHPERIQPIEEKGLM